MRVVIIEDDRRYRMSLRTVIQHTPGLELAGAWSRLGDVAVSADVALVSGCGDIPARLAAARAALPSGIAIVITDLPDDHATAWAVLEAGADGYVPRSASGFELLAVLRAASRSSGGFPTIEP